ncbi:MAG: hypothetical protein CBD97_03375 [Pelagibacteraceae bacterium TMED237]|nr:MAG: hypothetical protein CBD97_03375 [Pelagibacteraceae bacterium TMED237]
MQELIGHDTEFKIITNKFKKNNLHSSIIIHGPKGIGKRTFINNLVLNAFNDKYDGKSLAHHTNLFLNLSHPNIKILKREADKKTKKITSSITIDQIRNIRNFLNESSSIIDLPKIIIIDSADDFNLNSANAFLKTLEEPSNNTYIFLISHKISSLLPTIRSRCLKIKLNNHNYDNFKKIFINSIDNLKEDEIKFLSEITNGCPGDSISLYDDNIFDLFDLTIKCLTLRNITNDHINLTNILSKFDNDQFKNYLYILKSTLLIINKFKLNYYDSNKIISNKISNLQKISTIITIKNIIDRLEFLSINENDLFDYNLDKRIFMLNFLNC